MEPKLKTLVIDASFLDHLRKRKVVTSTNVFSEMSNLGLLDLARCLGIKRMETESSRSCEDDVLRRDVLELASKFRSFGWLDSKTYTDVRKNAEKDPRFAYLQLFNTLPDKLDPPNYKYANVRNDCSLITLTEKENGILVTDDKRLYGVCVEKLGKDRCRLMI